MKISRKQLMVVHTIKINYIFLSEQFNIPEGIYDLKILIKFLNNVLGEYDIFISNDKNGKIRKC